MSDPPAGGRRDGTLRGVPVMRLMLLAAAALLLVLGLSWRSERLRGLGRGEAESIPTPAALSRDLALNDSLGALFFPLWEEWRRRDGELAAELARDRGMLEELSREQSDLNQEQGRLLARTAQLRVRRLAAADSLLAAVRARLGLWRAARLDALLDRAPARP